MTSHILEADGLSKSFGALRAVDNVSLAVPKGQVWSVIGPNGAGKSTLFNLLSGTLAPDAGAITFVGADISARPPHQRLALGLARSFQITNLFSSLSVLENVRLACQARAPRRQFLRRLGHWQAPVLEARAILSRFELGPWADVKAEDLSHGDQRRLEIAVCMGARPKLLLLDEPTQGMGREETQATDELIRSLAGDTTILLVEHDVELVMSISDHVLVMHQGRKIAEGDPQEIRTSAAVREAYLGEIDTTEQGHA